MIKENLIILTTTDCPGCEDLKRQIGEKIPVYDVQKSDDAIQLAIKEKVTIVPAVLKKDSNGKWSKCKLSFNNGKVNIKCKNKNVEI